MKIANNHDNVKLSEALNTLLLIGILLKSTSPRLYQKYACSFWPPPPPPAPTLPDFEKEENFYLAKKKKKNKKKKKKKKKK